MTKTKTIPLEVPEDLDFERAEFNCFVVDYCGDNKAIVNMKKKPTWHWNESPTDEMALLRPDCEVRQSDYEKWRPDRLLGVRGIDAISKGAMKYTTAVGGYSYCRVRLDRDGKVIVRWGDGQ